MPNSRSLLRVRFLWLFRAVAFLFWVLWILAAVRSSSFGDGRWSSHQYGIRAASAVWIWHSVNSGFFPPELLSRARQEQVADGTQDQMAFQPQITPTFVVLLYLSGPLPQPSRRQAVALAPVVQPGFLVAA